MDAIAQQIEWLRLGLGVVFLMSAVCISVAVVFGCSIIASAIRRESKG